MSKSIIAMTENLLVQEKFEFNVVFKPVFISDDDIELEPIDYPRSILKPDEFLREGELLRLGLNTDKKMSLSISMVETVMSPLRSFEDKDFLKSFYIEMYKSTEMDSPVSVINVAGISRYKVGFFNYHFTKEDGLKIDPLVSMFFKLKHKRLEAFDIWDKPEIEKSAVMMRFSGLLRRKPNDLEIKNLKEGEFVHLVGI